VKTVIPLFASFPGFEKKPKILELQNPPPKLEKGGEREREKKKTRKRK